MRWMMMILLLSGCTTSKQKDGVDFNARMEVTTPECVVVWEETQVRDKGSNKAEVKAP